MPLHSKLISMTHVSQNPFGRSEDIVYFIISLFLVTAEAAILDDQFVKNCKSLTQYRSKFIFIFLLFLVTAADGHLGLPSHINLKGLHLQTSLIECD